MVFFLLLVVVLLLLQILSVYIQSEKNETKGPSDCTVQSLHVHLKNVFLRVTTLITDKSRRIYLYFVRYFKSEKGNDDTIRRSCCNSYRCR